MSPVGHQVLLGHLGAAAEDAPVELANDVGHAPMLPFAEDVTPRWGALVRRVPRSTIEHSDGAPSQIRVGLEMSEEPF
jgi:hypothetical protein